MSITRTQSNHASAAGGGTTLNVSLTGVGVASLVCLSTSYDIGGGGTESVADDLSANALPINNTSAGGFSQSTALWYYKNYGGGNRTFSQVLSVSHLNRGITVAEAAGADTTAPLEGTASNNGTSASPSSGNVSPAPSRPGTYLFGRCEGANQPSSASPASDIFQDSTTFGDTEDYTQPAASAIGLTWSMTSGSFQALAASFIPADNRPQRRALSHQQRRAA